MGSLMYWKDEMRKVLYLQYLGEKKKNRHMQNITVFAYLKVPKREIFVTELIILSHPIWIGDFRNEPKNRFV